MNTEMRTTGFYHVSLAVLLILGPRLTVAAEPESHGGEATFLSRVRQLTFEGRRSGEGYFSPDGQALIFQSEREPGNPFYQIYLLDLETGDSHRVSPGIGKTTCGFFQPGTDRVLFASTHLDPESRAKQKAELEFRAAGKERRYSWDYDEHMDIFSARRDGSALQRLTDALGYDAEASYSPDGNRIVFCSLRSAYPTNRLSAADLKRLETDPAWFGEIYIMRADGSDVRQLTSTPGYDGGPFFSPDGQRILWRRFTPDGVTADLYTMRTDGSDPHRLTDFKAMSWAPFYHPSGRYVIFTSNKLGFSNFELYLVDGAGEREPVRVTFTDGFDGLPVFSPDGRRLSWTSNRTPDARSQLFLAEWNHEAALAALQGSPSRSKTEASNGPLTVAAEGRHSSADISGREMKAEVAYLASDKLEGRMTGNAGARLASEYIVEHLEAAALQPMGSTQTWFQPFAFTAGVQILTNENELTVTTTHGSPVPFEVNKDFRPLSFTANGTIEGEVIFVGYGLTVPGKVSDRYDSYAGLNVSNKVVLALRYAPEDVEPKRRAELNRYAGLRYKVMLAREHGARGVLFVTGPNSPNAGELAGLAFDGSLAGSSIVAASVSSNVVTTLLGPSGKDLKALQTALDKENPHAESGFVLPGVRLKITAAVAHLKKSDRNVIGYLPPSGDSRECVLIGAHYDHLGYGEAGAMRRKGEENKIHPGADDNASGVSVVLELAAALSHERQRNPQRFSRGILFALWSGEELGLLGSSYFAEHPAWPLTNIVAYLNFDMVGRLRENKLDLQGTGSSPAWPRLIEKRNVAAGFNLVLQEDPYLPTDVTALYPKHIPVLNFFTGSHEEYHRPADTPATLNYEGLERIAKFARGLILDLVALSDRPSYLVVARSDAGGASRETLRAYLGTIPDYATEVKGVKLSGVRAEGPADKGGLKGGDVIVEFGGQKVANIYDYTYALDAVKIGQPVKVVVIRDGKSVTLSVTPEARK
jgi:Tol biopolymer transport system component